MSRTIVSIAVSLLSVAAGALAQPRPIAPASIAPTSFSISGATVAASGDRFVTAWPINTFAGSRIDGITLDREGKRTTESARRLVNDAVTARVLRAGNGSLLTYENSLRVRHFLRLNADGAPAGDSGLPSFTNAPIVIGSEDGRRILVVRYEIGRIAGVLLDENGSIVRDDVLLAHDSTELFGVDPAGDGFLLLRRTSSGLIVNRISSAGDVSSDATAIATHPNGSGSAAATDGERTLLLWNVAAVEGEATLFGALIRGNTIEKRFEVAQSAAMPMVPRKIFWTGESYLLIASTGPYANESIAALRFDRNGGLLDREPLPLMPQPQRHLFSDAAWNGDLVVVTAHEQTTIMGSRGIAISFRANGGIHDVRSDVLTLLPARQNAPASASDGRASLVAWREGGVDGQLIRAAIIGDTAPSEPLMLMSTTGLTGEPVVAYGGGVYLVVWEYFQHLLAARVSRDGVLLDAPFTVVENQLGNFGTPAIAWNGQQFLVAWSGFPIRGVFVMAAGAVGAPRDLTGAKYGGYDPALAFNGRRFILAFTVPLPMAFPVVPTPVEIDGLALRADGSPIAEEPSLLIRDASRPRLATSGNDFLVIGHAEGTLSAAWLDESSVRLGDPFTLGSVASSAFGAAATVAWSGDSYVIARHVFAGMQIRAERLAPGSTRSFDVRAFPSRPDRTGGTSVAIAPRERDPLIIFTDIRHDDASGGSARLLFDRFGDLPHWQARRRIVTR